MIPYFQQPTLDLGIVTIHMFGVLVAAGILLGLAIFRRRSARMCLDTAVGNSLVVWILVGGFVGAHILDSLFYGFKETLEAPWRLFDLRQGISSYGGFVGAALGGFLFLRRNPQGPNTWRYLDTIAYAFPFGWFFGRLGCFVAFDHVGSQTNSWLGQRYLDGVVRHNLGLLEALYTLALIALMLVLGRNPRPAGRLISVLAIAYAPGRFLLDFLRVSDERHGGLLVSQYASIALFALGLWGLWNCRRNRRAWPSGGRL